MKLYHKNYSKKILTCKNKIFYKTIIKKTDNNSSINLSIWNSAWQKKIRENGMYSTSEIFFQWDIKICFIMFNIWQSFTSKI